MMTGEMTRRWKSEMTRRRGETSSRGRRKRREISRRRTSKKTMATIQTQGRRFK